MTEWKLFLLKEEEVAFLRETEVPARLKPQLQAPAAPHLGIILFFMQWLAGVS